MEERTKTNKKIFEEKYSYDEVSQNPFLCAEAIGYLKALTQYFPSEENWVNSKLLELLVMLAFHTS